MKKIGTVASICVLSGCLVACSDKEKTDVDQTETEQLAENKTLSIEVFLKQMDEAPMNINSFATDTTVTTTTVIDGKEEKMPLHISLIATLEPLRVQQFIDMDLRENGLGRIKGISYMQDGFMYMALPQDGAWVKTTIPNFEETLKQSLNQSPSEQVAFVKKYAHLFTVQETKEAYLLRFNGTEKNLQALIEGQLASLLNEHTLPIPSNKKWTFETLTYNMVLDKNTFFPVSLHLSTELRSTANEEAVRTQLDMRVVYRDINAISSIELPEEAKNAKNITE